MMLAALTIASCSDNKFTVEGQIGNAKDSVLYFENVGLEGINVLDSVKLSDDGEFAFHQEAPGAPEFYRLRIADQIINVSIDSTETVQIKGTYPNMAADYTTPQRPYRSRVPIRIWQPTTLSAVLRTAKRSGN